MEWSAVVLVAVGALATILGSFATEWFKSRRDDKLALREDAKATAAKADADAAAKSAHLSLSVYEFTAACHKVARIYGINKQIFNANETQWPGSEQISYFSALAEAGQALFKVRVAAPELGMSAQSLLNNAKRPADSEEWELSVAIFAEEAAGFMESV